MEVHAHTHTARKKWTHYLWEFLMLFLAVFCGFLAENQREHLIEHQREKKYMESLLEDLQKDTEDLDLDKPFWEKYINRIDTMRSELRKPASSRNNSLLYRCVLKMRQYDNFKYNDRTIEQLKSGGNFRLIRKKSIADSLIVYDATIRSSLRDQELQSNTIWQSLNVLQDKLFMMEFFEYMNDNLVLDSAILRNPEFSRPRNGKEEELFEYYNRLQYFQVVNMYRLETMMNLNRRANNLIRMIKNEYRLQ